MTNLASSVTWGASYGSPTITVSFYYEYTRVGADMQYRVQITINPVSGIRYFGYPIYAQVSLDGLIKDSTTLKSASPSQWTSAITYTTPWLTVTGKTTGTTSLAIKLYSGSGSSRTETYNYSLIVSPAASTVSAQSGDIGSAIPITIGRKNSSFTHTLKYSFVNTSGTIITNTSSTSVSWTPPLSLCNQLPSVLSGTCTITCETYSGNSLVGSETCDVKLTVPKSVQLSVYDGWASVSVYNTGTAAASIPAFVQGYSKAYVTFNANKISTANSYGATIKSYKIVYGSATVTASPFITPTLTNSGTMTVYCYVTDTRDRTVGSAITFIVLPYFPPTLSGIEMFRCDSSGAADSAGSYISVKATPGYSSLNGNNSITFRVRYGVNANNYGDYTTLASGVASILGGGSLLSTSSYIVEISLIDSLGKTSIYIGHIPTDDVSFHIAKGGKRAAFFKYAEKYNTLEVGGDLEVSGKLNSPFIVNPQIISGITGNNYYGNNDNDETALNAWLDELLNNMPNKSMQPVTISCYPAVSGYLYQGFIFKNSNDYASLSLRSYSSATMEKVKFNGVWGNVRIIPTMIGASAYAVDYVIDQGTTGAWTYRKWESGKIEIHGHYSQGSTNCDRAYGSVYISQMLAVALPSIDFTIKAVSINVDLLGGIGGVCIANNNDYSGSGINYFIWHATSRSNFSPVLDVYITGTWK